MTPELTPNGNDFPGLDLLRDKYIRNDPRSGIAMNIVNPALVVGNRIRQDIMHNEVNSGTLPEAYLKGVPGVPKPITPDVVKPAVHPMDFYTL